MNEDALFPARPVEVIYSFEFENGKIKLQREFMSPSQRLRALGIDVPAVRCDRIPT